MRPGLMFVDGDFEPNRPEPPQALDLIADLELETLWAAMSRGDERLWSLARAGTLSMLTDPADIEHRQHALADCLRNPGAVREMYELAVEALAAEQKFLRGGFTGNPTPLLNRSVRVLEAFTDLLRRLRGLADRLAKKFTSPAFDRMFRLIATRLDEPYLREIEATLRGLDLEYGIVVSARLGDGGKGTGFDLQEPPTKSRGSHRELKQSRHTYTVTGEANEHDFRALAQLRDRSLNGIASVTAQSAERVRSFFVSLRDELGFYLGCVNLASRFGELGVATCRPEIRSATEPAAVGLTEPCLALRLGRPVVTNDVDIGAAELVLVTGSNQGGKSTFLRSVGVARLMAQAGMFVAAQRFAAQPANGIFTHFTREEDASMTSGRLDAELSRISAFAEDLRAGSLVLCNESFSSTNEREGSAVAGEFVTALMDSGVRVVFVTHLYELAAKLSAERPERCAFLRAQRHSDGERTYRIVPGPPDPTAHGVDLYRRIFGTDPR